MIYNIQITIIAKKNNCLVKVELRRLLETLIVSGKTGQK
jgi:hypothetical protein